MLTRSIASLLIRDFSRNESPSRELYVVRDADGDELQDVVLLGEREEVRTQPRR